MRLDNGTFLERQRDGGKAGELFFLNDVFVTRRLVLMAQGRINTTAAGEPTKTISGSPWILLSTWNSELHHRSNSERKSPHHPFSRSLAVRNLFCKNVFTTFASFMEETDGGITHYVFINA